MELMFLHWLNLMNIRLGFYMEREIGRETSTTRFLTKVKGKWQIELYKYIYASILKPILYNMILPVFASMHFEINAVPKTRIHVPSGNNLLFYILFSV